jgi:hypothetical protein
MRTVKWEWQGRGHSNFATPALESPRRTFPGVHNNAAHMQPTGAHGGHYLICGRGVRGRTGPPEADSGVDGWFRRVKERKNKERGVVRLARAHGL